jgi:hypothetical protein
VVRPRAGLDGYGISRPNGIRSPDRPARSESLYRLSYPGPPKSTNFTYITLCVIIIIYLLKLYFRCDKQY